MYVGKICNCVMYFPSEQCLSMIKHTCRKTIIQVHSKEVQYITYMDDNC